MTLQKCSTEPILNEYIMRLGNWISLHDEDIHFKGWPTERPTIKLCSQTLRIRANQAFKTLSKPDQECMVAHEMGHREYQHHLGRSWAPPIIHRILSVIEGKAFKDEEEADRYAAKLVGKEKYIAFLERQMKETPYDIDSTEFKYRIKALEE